MPAYPICASTLSFGRDRNFCKGIRYDTSKDNLYLRLDPRKQDVTNRQLIDDVVLDIGEGDKIAGIEILDASDRLNLHSLLPVEFASAVKASR